MVEQALQSSGASGMADDSHMETYRQHFGVGGTFPVKEVERIPAVGKEVIPCREGAAAKLRVVGRQAVGHDQMPFALDRRPIWQLIIISI